jgi:hypothetical protein
MFAIILALVDKDEAIEDEARSRLGARSAWISDTIAVAASGFGLRLSQEVAVAGCNGQPERAIEPFLTARGPGN